MFTPFTAPIQPIFQRPQQVQMNKSESFRQSIVAMFDFCKEMEKYDMFKLSVKLGFHRRRFYDVLNVLEAVGCCEKINTEEILWLGLRNVPLHITKLAENNHIYDSNRTLKDIIPEGPCISISKVTEYLILSFLCLGTQKMDIKSLSNFFSTDDGKYKTTLCKLYQITHILESAGIVTKTDHIGEIYLREPYFIHIKDQKQKVEFDDPLSINQLLSRPAKCFNHNYIASRREEFKSRSQRVMSPPPTPYA